MATKPRVPGTPAQTPSDEAPAIASVVCADGDLPNSIDINPRAIRGPVLTKQGWVVPDEDWQKANPAEFKALLG
ncbi:hypothetical protein [Roseateles sp. PN1]|uniref:hypothetical protein n=1 Tax=Roseateles sp. PN1 TaxID=3137372 RepID=UPI003139CAB0